MRAFLRSALACAIALLAGAFGCLAAAQTPKPDPITTSPWAEASISVTDLERTAALFREIGGYETIARGRLSAADIAAWGLAPEARGTFLALRARGAEHGVIRLIRFDRAGRQEPTRPAARAWDTGCFWSVMVRARNIETVLADAIRLGWWHETPIARLEFAGSTVKVVVLKGPDGVQVQTYERIAPPLSPDFPPFERLSQPFNIMQMVDDRDAFRRLAVDVMGFETLWYGPAYLDAAPTVMPIGIPINLTTSVPFVAGIFTPKAGEFGRMEVIEIGEGLTGQNYSARCKAPNLGILRVSYPVADIAAARARFTAAQWPAAREITRVRRAPYGWIDTFSARAPDGAEIEFFQSVDR